MSAHLIHLVPVLAAMGLCACLARPPSAGAQDAPVVPSDPAHGAVHVASEGVAADLARVAAFHETRPIYERSLDPGMTPVEGVADLSAATCGGCHVAIYEEWRTSTHAAAWRDRQFQAEITKSDNRWLCLNCHTPLLVQQDAWPVGLIASDVEQPQLVENAAFSDSLRDEGITCAACHVRDGIIHGPGRDVGEAPHAVAVDPDFTTSAVCLRCHQAIATYPGKGFVCVFDTGSEWAAGPFAGSPCMTCHMPSIERPAAVGAGPRTVGQHWWRGAGIAKEPGGGTPERANAPGLDLAATWAGETLQVTGTNARAGHRLPTGDPERWVQVDVVFSGPDGPVGDPFSARIGQTWEWWPAPKKLGDNRLAPSESRTWPVPVPVGAQRAVVTASSHRMTPETAQHHDLGDYPLSVITSELTVQRP